MAQSIPCSSCGTTIPGVVAEAPFCPYCGARKSVQAPSPAGVPGVAASPPASARPFTAPFTDLRLLFDPRAGFALIGAYAPEGKPPCLRAFDLLRGHVAWEAFAGERAVADLDWESIAVHSGNVYVAVGRSLRVLDLFTGQQKWGAELSDQLGHDSRSFAERGPRVTDPAPPGTRGPVWIRTIDDTIAAFDRDSGQPLWRETREESPRYVLPFEAGLVLLDHSHTLELVDPATRAVLDKVGPRVERMDLEGRYGVLQVDNWGWRERDGILVHDFLAKKELLFEAVERLEDDVPSVTGHGRVFAATESGAKLFAGPPAKQVELIPGFHIRTMAMCGPTLMVLLSKHHGTGYRRFVGVDPQSLAVRFDLGEWTHEPNDDWTEQLCSNGHVAITVTSPTGRYDTCDLLAVDPAGRILWKLPVGEWKAHSFLGGYVVVHSSMGWQIVRPDNGQVVAVYAPGDDD
jgi:outer membrane protein assembly factor BamB